VAEDLKLYIAGEWTEGTGDEVHELISPVTGEHIATVPMASAADIDLAVAAAQEAQGEFRHWSAFERAALLHRIADAVVENVDEIARIQTLEQGKPYHAESLADIAEANEYFTNAAEDVKRLEGRVIPTTDRNKRMFTFNRPVGVWAAITPWNFPVTIPLEYVGPGLATGNALIVKPPEFTPWGLLKLAEAFDAAGVPEGLISIIPGGAEVGETLVTHAGIDAIGFTGSSGDRAPDHLPDGQALDHGDVGQWPNDRHRRRQPRSGSRAGRIRRLLQRRTGVLRHRASDRGRRGARRVCRARPQGVRRRASR
jgi:succinate-semialdehyde dehydrogenase/glutarate-semialdehyde dehydrogenase